MKRIFRLGIVLFLAVMSVAVSHAETERMFFKLDGIDGESADAGHLEWIDVLSCNRGHVHGSMQSIQTGSPEAAGRGIYEPFVFTHIVDKATPKLQEACANGSFISVGEFHDIRRTGSGTNIMYTVRIEDAKIIRAEVKVVDLADGGCRLVEKVYLLCGRVVEEVVTEVPPVEIRLPALPDRLSASWTSLLHPEPQPITDSVFVVAPGSTNVVIHFATEDGYMLIGAESLDLGSPVADVSVPAEDVPDAALAATVSYRAWTGGGFAEGTTNAAVVSAETTRLVDGYWYVAQGAVVNTNRLTVSGAAHLVLADGATLSTKGILVREGRALSIYGQTAGTGTLVADSSSADLFAGIGGDGNFAAGKVEIHGGIVRATGGADAAGIGGGCGQSGGEIAIYGGRVGATGGSLAPGIGGGRDQLSGISVFKLFGGTVRAAKGENTSVAVGHAGGGSGICSNIVCGGSLEVDGTVVSAPVDAEGRELFDVKVLMPVGTDENAPVALAGLPGYGGESVYPLGGAFHLWLPNGSHDFTANGLGCTVRVADRAVTIIAGATGLYVNGVDIAVGSGEGWVFKDKQLTLGMNDEVTTFVVDGTLTDACIHVMPACETVVLSNAMITVTNAPALSVDVGCDVCILTAGETSQLESDNGFAAIRVPVGSSVTFGTLRREAILYCFAEDGGAAIGGNVGEPYGCVTIEDGIIAAWSGDADRRGAAVGSGTLPEGAEAPQDTAGVITISGGFLCAETVDGSSALGAGAGSRGGKVVVTGGTVQIDRAMDTANGASIDASEIKITGGSVVVEEGTMAPAPSNGTERVWRVDLPAELLARASQTNVLELSGLDGYGLDGIVPFKGRAAVWLTNGVHHLDVRLNGSQIKLSATVADTNTVFVIDDFEGRRGVTVNGTDVGWGAGPGWKLCDDDYVQLDGTLDNPVLSGSNTQGTVMFEIDANMTLTLSNLTLCCKTANECCIWATNDVTATIWLVGTNTLDASAVSGEGLCIENGCDLTVMAHPGISDDEAVLIAKGGRENAAIATGRNGNVGDIPRLTIESGTVRAYGGSGSAGIGGSFSTEDFACATAIAIRGGRVFAWGGSDWDLGGGAGIGSSAENLRSANVFVSVSGGYVESHGGNDAAGIGGGCASFVGKVEISGGTVHAIRGEYGSALSRELPSDIMPVDLMCGWDKSVGAGRLVISGGSVVMEHIAEEAPRPAPVNAANAAVWCVTFEDVQPVVDTVTEVIEVPDGGFYTNVSEIIETTISVSTNEFGVVSTNIDEQVTFSTNLVPTFVTVTNVTETRTYPVTGVPAGYDVRGIEPVGGKVMLWLPDGDYAIGVGESDYVVRVTGANVTAMKLEEVVWVPSGGESEGYAVREFAEYMMDRAQVRPPAEAEKALTTRQAMDIYQSCYSFRLFQDGDLWKFAPYLPPVSTNLLQQSVDNAMTAFDIEGVAGMEMGEEAEMDFGWCIPGFFYTLRSGATLKGIRTVEGATKPGMSDSHVVLPVAKPDEGAGFFRLSVSDQPAASDARSD